MTNIYICSLPPEIKECEFRDENLKCLMSEGCCGFKIKEEKSNQSVRKLPKWFEKYYSSN